MLSDTAGTPLTTGQANAIVDVIWLWQDTDRDLELTGADALVAQTASLTLNPSGRLTLPVADGAAAAAIDPTVSWGYFLELRATSNASAQVPNQIRVEIPGELERECYSLRVQDRDHDLALSCEPRGAVVTRAIAFGAWGGQLLADGFERGTTSAWSYAAP